MGVLVKNETFGFAKSHLSVFDHFHFRQILLNYLCSFANRFRLMDGTVSSKSEFVEILDKLVSFDKFRFCRSPSEPVFVFNQLYLHQYLFLPNGVFVKLRVRQIWPNLTIFIWRVLFRQWTFLVTYNWHFIAINCYWLYDILYW